MRSFSLLVAVFTVVCAVLMGCDTIFPFQSEKSGIAQRLDFDLRAPDTVAVDDSFEVRFTIQNRGKQRIRLTTGNSCLLELRTFSDGERVAFRGTQFGCFPAITPHRVPGNGALGRTFELRASGYDGKNAVTSGTYTVRADFGASIGPGLDGETIRKVLRHDLVVRK